MTLRWLNKCVKLLLLLSFKYVQSSEVTFCDGETKIQKSREQCSAGFKFGDKKPDCVCIKGMYVRIYIFMHYSCKLKLEHFLDFIMISAPDTV